MFSKKKKEAQKLAARHELTEFMAQVESCQKEIGGIADAGERLFAWEKLREDIYHAILKREKDVRGRVPGTDTAGWIGIGCAMTSIVLAPLTAGISLIAFAPACGTSIVAGHYKHTVQRRRILDTEDLIAMLHVQKDLISASIQEILQNDVHILARSQRAEDIFKKYPSIGAQFGIAALQKNKQPPAAKHTGRHPGFEL